MVTKRKPSSRAPLFSLRAALDSPVFARPNLGGAVVDAALRHPLAPSPHEPPRTPGVSKPLGIPKVSSPVVGVVSEFGLVAGQGLLDMLTIWAVQERCSPILIHHAF